MALANRPQVADKDENGNYFLWRPTDLITYGGYTQLKADLPIDPESGDAPLHSHQRMVLGVHRVMRASATSG